jgi:hypothetical protein
MPPLAPYRAPLAPSSSTLARAFGAPGKPTTYDPVRVLTHNVPKALEKHGPFAVATFSAIELDDSELGKQILDVTKFRPSTIGLGVGLVVSALPVPKWAIDLGLDLALACGFAKALRGRAAMKSADAAPAAAPPSPKP